MKKTHTIIVDTDKITFPDSTEQTTKAVRSATLVVAANDSEVKSKAQADYVCDGTDDHLEIQAAIDALPATGGEVFLLEGTYYIEVSLVLDSYQTLRGCGRNTILTTTTAALDVITATGGAGTEKVGILITDLCIDGTAGGASVNYGILFTYIDYSRVVGIWALNCDDAGGIRLLNSDFNEIIGNIGFWSYYFCRLDASNNNVLVGNSIIDAGDAIRLLNSSYNTILGNNIQGSSCCGLWGGYSNHNTISGNNIQGSRESGISLEGNYNTISGNTIQRSAWEGIYLNSSFNNIFSGNDCSLNSQETDNAYDNITLANKGDHNLITNNLCRAPTIGTTLTTGESAGATDIHVTDTTGFEVGMGVVIDLGGGLEEYHRISAITAGTPGVITIDAGLANDQGVGETIAVPEARYGININAALCENNIVTNNDLYDAGKTAPFNDAGTGTKLAVYVVPFSHGSDPQDSGFEIDVDAEFARAWLRLPPEVQQVVRMKVYARSVVAEVHEMELQMVVKGGADNEAFGTHDGSIAQLDSASVNFAADDIIFWINTEAGILALVGGDSVEVKVLHEAAEGDNCETDAFFRTVEIEYV